MNIGEEQEPVEFPIPADPAKTPVHEPAPSREAPVPVPSELFEIDGVPACGVLVDGGRCGRAPEHEGHPHIADTAWVV